MVLNINIYLKIIMRTQISTTLENGALEPFYTHVPDNSGEIWGQHPQWPGSQASLFQCFCRYKVGTQSPPGDLSRQKSCLMRQKKPFLQKTVVTFTKIFSGFNVSVRKPWFFLGT